MHIYPNICHTDFQNSQRYRDGTMDAEYIGKDILSIDEESTNEQRKKNGTNYQTYWIK